MAGRTDGPNVVTGEVQAEEATGEERRKRRTHITDIKAPLNTKTGSDLGSNAFAQSWKRDLTFEKPGNYIVNDNITLSGRDVHASKKSKATLVVTSKLNEIFGICLLEHAAACLVQYHTSVAVPVDGTRHLQYNARASKPEACYSVYNPFSALRGRVAQKEMRKTCSSLSLCTSTRHIHEAATPDQQQNSQV